MSEDDLWFDEPEYELNDEEYPDEEAADDDSSLVSPCPECGAEVYEDAVQCPVCGHFITHDTHVWSERPAWWILLGVLGVVAAILVLARLAPW